MTLTEQRARTFGRLYLTNDHAECVVTFDRAEQRYGVEFINEPCVACHFFNFAFVLSWVGDLARSDQWVTE